jgi:alpha-L-fucosidase
MNLSIFIRCASVFSACLVLSLAAFACGGTKKTQYLPTHESLRGHPVPAWFQDAKLGIFVHWGPASVPGWAPLTGSLNEVLAEHGWEYWFANNSYAEWYWNSMQIAGSPTAEYHLSTYGADFAYEDFIPEFKSALQNWEPENWVSLFARVGARYVVLVTKHHDGFLLWPSENPNPHREGYFSERDIVGELARAVRGKGMRFGIYYSGGLDWTFADPVIRNVGDLFAAIPTGADYAAYADTHWRELIERYRPAILWNDIGYPAGTDLFALFADYYNRVPDGVVNNRWAQNLADAMLGLTGDEGLDQQMLEKTHFDFTTPEYKSLNQVSSLKWESIRGMGYSFGYNRQEEVSTDHLLTVDELVDMLVDITSKNGNLLLNVGPRADGTIPEPQTERLEELGEWLAVNGEAVFETRPWTRAEGRADGGTVRVRFTQNAGPDRLYAILLDRPAGGEVAIESLKLKPGTRVRLLGNPDELKYSQAGENLVITLPAGLSVSAAYALRINPRP